MSSPDPAWKRILGGLVGLLLMVALLLFARSRGVSGDEVQRRQLALVMAGAAAGLVFLIIKRKR